jgi:hypothetical protein
MDRLRNLIRTLFDHKDEQFRSVAIALTVLGALAFLSFVMAGIVGLVGA